MENDAYQVLIKINKKYNQKNSTSILSDLRDIYKRTITEKRRSYLDIFISAINLSVNIFNAESSPNPLVIEAIKTTNPNFEYENLNQYSDSEMQGIINSAKGKYFELLVVDKLNSGDSVGGIVLPNGARAVLADSLNQPGWDLRILDEHGHNIEFLQLKATENLEYIGTALAKYPDFRILTTSEIDSINPGIIESNISDEDLTLEVSRALSGEVMDFTDKFFEAFNPFFPILVVLAREGYQILFKNVNISRQLQIIAGRTERILVSSSMGAIAFGAGLGWLSVPISFLVGLIHDKQIENESIYSSYTSDINKLKWLFIHQKNYHKEFYGFNRWYCKYCSWFGSFDYFCGWYNCWSGYFRSKGNNCCCKRCL